MTLNLKTPITLKAKNTSFYLQINSVEIPFSFYGLSADITSLNCTFINGANIKESTIILDAGNYNSNSVLNELKSKLITEAQIASGSYTGFIPDLSFTYSASNGKAIFSMSNAGCQIILKFSENLNLGIFFGCNENILISPLSVVTSNNACIANPITSLLVRSPTFKQINNREFIVVNDDYCDILKQVPITTGQNTYICDYQDSDLIYITNNEINDFNLYLTNNLTYNPIDLKGLNWSISFSILEIIDPKFEPFQTVTSLFIAPIEKERGEGELPSGKENEETKNKIDILEKQKEDLLNKIEKYKSVVDTRLKNDMGYLEKLLEKKKIKNII